MYPHAYVPLSSSWHLTIFELLLFGSLILGKPVRNFTQHSGQTLLCIISHACSLYNDKPEVLEILPPIITTRKPQIGFSFLPCKSYKNQAKPSCQITFIGTSLSCSLVLLQIIKSSTSALRCGFQGIHKVHMLHPKS